MFHVSGHLNKRLLKYIWFWLPSVGMYLASVTDFRDNNKELTVVKAIAYNFSSDSKIVDSFSSTHQVCSLLWVWILHNIKNKLPAWWRSRIWLSLPVSLLALCPKFELLTCDFNAGFNSCLQCYDKKMQCHGIMEISCWIFCLIRCNGWGLFMHTLFVCVPNKSKSLEFKLDEQAGHNPYLITCLPIASSYTFIDLVAVWAIALFCL
jgi:hypothetical protein